LVKQPNGKERLEATVAGGGVRQLTREARDREIQFLKCWSLRDMQTTQLVNLAYISIRGQQEMLKEKMK
jgi:hypothetical protein